MTEKLYKNDFTEAHVGREYITVPQVYRGLCHAAIDPKKVPREILREIRRRYGHNSLSPDDPFLKGK